MLAVRAETAYHVVLEILGQFDVIGGRNHRQVIVLVCVGEVAKTVLEDTAVLEHVDNFVCFKPFGRSCVDYRIGPVIDSLFGYLTGRSYLAGKIIPYRVDIYVGLQYVGFRGAVKQVWLDCALESADLDNLHFNTEFVKRVFEIRNLCGDTADVYRPDRVEADGIGHTCHVIVALRIAIAVRLNPFAGLLEFLQGLDKFLAQGVPHRGAVAFEVYAFNLFIVGGVAYGCYDGLETLAVFGTFHKYVRDRRHTCAVGYGS